MQKVKVFRKTSTDYNPNLSGLSKICDCKKLAIVLPFINSEHVFALNFVDIDLLTKIL